MNRSLIILVLAGMFCARGQAQVQTDLKEHLQRADYLQQLYFIDSLGLSHAQAQQYFVLRDQFREESDRIAADATLTESAQRNKFNELRREHIQSVKELFTPAVYQRYINWINRQLPKRNMTGNPLSEDY